jgi:hypothetical protein
MVGSCEHGNKLSGFIEDGEFLVQWAYHQLLKKDVAP